MDYQKIHAAILASVPELQRSVLHEGYAYVESYLQQYQMTWEEAYKVVEDVFYDGPPIASNDEPEPFEIELMSNRFNDRNMAFAMRHLFPLCHAACSVLKAQLTNQIDRGEASNGNVRDFVALQEAKDLYCAVLQTLNIPPHQAGLCYSKLCQEFLKMSPSLIAKG